MAAPPQAQLRPLPPAETIAYLRSKGYRPSFGWADMWHEEHGRQFTVAKVMRLDILADIREALDTVLAEGKTWEWFQQNLTPVLQDKGWWGRQDMTDPLDGEVKQVQLGSPRRLALIFDVNIRAAHAAGDWVKIQRVKAARPYLMYDPVLDGKTRPLHRSWARLVLLVDDPWWDTHYPPNGWRCRCRVRQLSQRDLDRYGLKLGQAPVINMVPWRNPRTGEVIHVAEGIDPGWGYNVGKEHMRSLVPPPSSGPLQVHAINPPADMPMPPPRPADPARLLPGIKEAGGLTKEEYLRLFLAEFGATPDKPALFRDVLDEPVMIGRWMFEDSTGELKVAKRGREKWLLHLADALKDPDEIWWVWRQNTDTKRWFLDRRYLKRITVDGKEQPLLAMFDVGPDGWNGDTIYQPDGKAYFLRHRAGVLAYRRPE